MSRIGDAFRALFGPRDDDADTCLHCEERIDAGETRFPIFAMHVRKSPAGIEHREATTRYMHRECMMRIATGGLLHMQGKCSCFDPTAPDDTDPPGMTRREGARVAFAAWREKFGN